MPPTPRCRGRYSFRWIALLTLNPYLITLSVKQRGNPYHFWVFGLTRAGIELQSLSSLVNSLTILPIFKYARLNTFYDKVIVFKLRSRCLNRNVRPLPTVSSLYDTKPCDDEAPVVLGNVEYLFITITTKSTLIEW